MIQLCRTFFPPLSFPFPSLTFTTTSYGIRRYVLLFHLFPGTYWTLTYSKCLSCGSREEKRACWRFYKDAGSQARHGKNSSSLLRFRLQQPNTVEGKSERRHKHESWSRQWVTGGSVSLAPWNRNKYCCETTQGLVAATAMPMPDGKGVFPYQDCYLFCCSRVTSTTLMVPA